MSGKVDAHVVYGYGGGDLVDPSLTAHPPRYSDVRVEATATPALLVLSAYEPTVWRINAAKDATIAGVYFTGYYEQMIVGLPEGVPVGRTHLRFRSKQKKQPCKMDPLANQKGDVPESLAEKMKTHSKISSKLRAVSNSIRNDQLPRTYERIKVLEETRAALVIAQASNAALGAIDAMKDEATAELSALQEQFTQLESQVSALSDGWGVLNEDFMSNTGANKGRSPSLAKFTNLSRPRQLAEFEKALRAQGDFSVVSYQTRSKNSTSFVVSDAASAAFSERKKEGAARLASLTVPQLPLLPSDAPLMTAPSEMIAGDGIKYLLEQGYLRK